MPTTFAKNDAVKVSGLEGIYKVVTKGAKNSRLCPLTGGEGRLFANELISPASEAPQVTPVTPVSQPAVAADSIDNLLAPARVTGSKRKNDAFEMPMTDALKAQTTAAVRAYQAHKDAEAAWKVSAASLQTVAEPFRGQKLASGEYAKTAALTVEGAEVQVQFTSRFSTVALETAPEISNLIGEDLTDTLFEKTRQLKLKDSVVGNAEILSDLLSKMAAAGIEVNEYFDYKVGLTPKEAFDTERYRKLNAGQRSALTELGVKQTVTVKPVLGK